MIVFIFCSSFLGKLTLHSFPFNSNVKLPGAIFVTKQYSLLLSKHHCEYWVFCDLSGRISPFLKHEPVEMGSLTTFKNCEFEFKHVSGKRQQSTLSREKSIPISLNGTGTLCTRVTCHFEPQLPRVFQV